MRNPSDVEHLIPDNGSFFPNVRLSNLLQSPPLWKKMLMAMTTTTTRETKRAADRRVGVFRFDSPVATSAGRAAAAQVNKRPGGRAL